MRRYLNDILNLREHADVEKTRSTICKGISFRGYNLWILVCSTVLACIGLDTNSTAVIIGAMLISPLMSPILGVGLSLATLDSQVLVRSIRNLFIAVGFSLVTSVVYFLLSPLGEPTAELQARTYPTLLDVLVALFGGIAGIVSISRHEQTTAIPGVAIATALMPPLCTAGFGIATSNWTFFLGAFYLFFINAVFISLATYLIVRYLHFPERSFGNSTIASRYRRWFAIISLLALTPSIYFLYTVYKTELAKKEIDTLVLSPIRAQGNEILRWEIINRDSGKLVKVYHSGHPVSDALKQSIDSNLLLHNMTQYHLLSMRVNLTREEVSDMSAETTRQLFREMHIDELLQKDTSEKKSPDLALFANLHKEVTIAFPYVDTVFGGWLQQPQALSRTDTIPMVFYQSTRPVTAARRRQLYQYLLQRLDCDTLVLMRQ